MSSKKLLVILAIMVGAIVVLALDIKGGVKSGVSGSSNSAEIVLSTNPDPLQMGTATFFIDVKNKSGKPVDNAKVFFDLNMTAMNMGTQQGDTTFQGNGRYSAMGRMTMRGPWRVSIKITMPDGTVENKDFTVDVP